MSDSSKRVAVLAIGGNSLISDNQHKEVSDQFAAAQQTCRHIVKLIKNNWNVIITHGNGPQVGFMLHRAELASNMLHLVPLDSIVGDTQGALGYMFQQILVNLLHEEGISRQPVSVVTQVLVDKDDPAFENPTKPIGSFLDEEEAQKRMESSGWVMKEDAGRGWRRVVPSPLPKKIIEIDAIKNLIDDEFVVIAVGGGGIPVVKDEHGKLKGVAAVIDKDFASALLATNLKIDTFIISTAVDAVYLDFQKPTKRRIAEMTVSEAKQYLAEGQFAAGSMSPKIEAAIKFLKSGGKEVFITSPQYLSDALEGKQGTRILP
jgi:carbamate kinase